MRNCIYQPPWPEEGGPVEPVISMSVKQAKQSFLGGLATEVLLGSVARRSAKESVANTLSR